jgi:iron complex outermembrane receptor protein
MEGRWAWRWLLAGILGLQATALYAAEEKKAARLEEVVVVASPITEGNQVNRLGSQVSTVTEEQIRDLNAQDFQSAVRMVPGVIISRQNPVGSFGGGDGGAIYIRGMGSSRPGGEIQMAVDGIPKNVGVWTHPLMDIMSVDQAQRIDIYKERNPSCSATAPSGS